MFGVLAIGLYSLAWEEKDTVSMVDAKWSAALHI